MFKELASWVWGEGEKERGDFFWLRGIQEKVRVNWKWKEFDVLAISEEGKRERER